MFDKSSTLRSLLSVVALSTLLSGCGTATASVQPTPSATVVPPTATQPPSANKIELKPCTLPGETQAECGTYSVYENRQARTGRMIDLRVAVVRAVSSDPAPDPMVYLAGGPGGAATQDFVGIGPAFTALNLKHDWLLIDQRGTGSSHRLLYPPIPPEVLNLDANNPETESIVRKWVEGALTKMDGDPRFYTTSVAVDDVDEVREALGYDKVNLYGGSYGATAAQYYLKQHGDHVRTAIFDGGTLLDVPIFEGIAPNGQRALELVFDRCAASESCNSRFPDLRKEMRETFDRLSKEPVTLTSLTHPLIGEPLVLTASEFAEVVRTYLLNAGSAARIPLMVHNAYKGDYDEVGRTYQQWTYQAADSTRLVMTWSIRCNEAWARMSPQEVERLSKDTYFLGGQLAIAQGQEFACKVLPKGVVPEGDGERVKSHVPVLILTGQVDPQDPPDNVANADRELPDSLRVTLPGHGHGVIQYGCLSTVASAFVTSGTVKGLSTDCVEDVVIPPFQ